MGMAIECLVEYGRYGRVGCLSQTEEEFQPGWDGKGEKEAMSQELLGPQVRNDGYNQGNKLAERCEKWLGSLN